MSRENGDSQHVDLTSDLVLNILLEAQTAAVATERVGDVQLIEAVISTFVLLRKYSPESLGMVGPDRLAAIISDLVSKRESESPELSAAVEALRKPDSVDVGFITIRIDGGNVVFVRGKQSIWLTKMQSQIFSLVFKVSLRGQIATYQQLAGIAGYEHYDDKAMHNLVRQHLSSVRVKINQLVPEVNGFGKIVIKLERDVGLYFDFEAAKAAFDRHTQTK